MTKIVIGSDPVLEVRDVTMRFGGLAAVKDLTMRVPRGALYGLIGPNGAGKTTVFNVLTGVYYPTEGEIRFDGVNIEKKKPYEITKLGAARTFQNIRLFADMTVLENVMTAHHLRTRQVIADAVIGTRKHQVEEEETRHRALELLKIFALDRFAEEAATGLPYGSQRRLEIARALAPISGDMTEGKGLNIGYFAQQELDVLRLGDNPLEHMIRLVKEVSAAGKISGQQTREQDLRSFLGNFNFGGDMVKQAVGSMSGGEKARLVLCMIVWQRPNLLLLDEPTNHLDLATREALSMALNEFEGTVMLVSHDRALLRAVCDEFWMVSRGGVEPFDGDLDDYQRYLLDEAKRLREEAKKANSPAPAATKKVAASAAASSAAGTSDTQKSASKKEDAQRRQQQSDAAKPLRKELEKIDLKIQSLTTEKGNLQALLTSTTGAVEIARTGKRLKAIENDLGTLEERWLELTDQIETAAV